MKLIDNMIRQGDVLLVPTTAASDTTQLPRDADGSLTLAHGEVTGHRHRFEGAHVTLRDPPEFKTRHLTVVRTAALLFHEEHTHVPIAPNAYDLPQQVEYTPEELRRVAD